MLILGHFQICFLFCQFFLYLFLYFLYFLFTLLKYNDILFFDRLLMDITIQLKQLGLNSSECTIYLFLLQNGLTLPPIVSRETGIARTNCYNIFSSLQEKGLIEERLDGKRKAYQAKSPDSIVQMLEVQRQAAVRLLPDLHAMYTVQKNKPAITYFSGWDEIKTLFYQTFEAKEICFMGDRTQLEPLTAPFFTYYYDELQKRGISYQEVTNRGTPVVPRETMTDLQSTAFLKNAMVLPSSVLIWNTSTALITTEEPAFATVIKNKAIFDTFYTLFKALKGA